MSLDDDKWRLVEPCALRATDRFTKAAQAYVNDEKKRRPYLPAWIALAGMADGIGTAIAMAVMLNTDSEGDKDGKIALDSLFNTARHRAELVIKWYREERQ
jgi:hypothetical protein